MAETPRQRLDRRLSALRQERSSFVPHWRELSEHITPRAARFLSTDRNKGYKANDKIINSTATQAARTLRSGMMSGLTSPARPWFRLTTPDPGMMEFGPVKAWLWQVEARMREVFAKSNLYNALPVIYGSLGVYGTAAMAVLEDDSDVIRCYPFPVGSFAIANSDRLIVDTCYREYSMTVRQLVQQFGLEACSTTVRSLYTTGAFEQWVEVVHAIEPNDERNPKRRDAKNKAWRSVYYEAGANEGRLLRVSGFDEMPVLAPRWDITGEDVYGHSPAMDALGDVKALQLMERRKAQAIDKLVNPPMVAPSALRNQRASLLPGDVTYVDVTAGQQGFAPAYEINPRIAELSVDIQNTEHRIQRAFYEDLFLMVSQLDDVRTATEIAARKEEKHVDARAGSRAPGRRAA